MESVARDNGKSEAHTAMWPYGRGAGRRSRTLAVLTWDSGHNYSVLTEDCERVRVRSLEELRSLMGTWKLDVYSLLPVRFLSMLPEALDSEWCTPCLSKTSGLVGFSLRYGRSRLWLGQASAWGVSNRSADYFLSVLRDTFTHCAVGERTTPASLGQAIWREQRLVDGIARVHRPPASLRNALLTHGIGGRVDTPGLGGNFSELYQLDLTGAYLAAIRTTPYGTAERFTRKCDPAARDDRFQTWFADCSIILPRQIDYSPIPVREKLGRVVYPGEPGYYRAWLWREEAEAAIQQGAALVTLGGWGWRSLSSENAGWSDRMHLLRTTAPTPDVAGIIKMATVAAIGRHGAAPERLEVSRERVGDGAPLMDHRGLPTQWWVNTIPEPDSNALTHWFQWTIKETRMRLYRRVLAEFDAGLVATDYDAAYFSSPPSVDPADDSGELGSWKRVTLHNCVIPAARSILADEVSKRPGVLSGSVLREQSHRGRSEC